MKYFEFNNLVKICSGKNAIVNIKHELDYLKVHTPLILSDEGLLKAGTLKDVLKTLRKNGVNTGFVWTSIPVDSSTLTITEIAGFYKANNCDSIIAIGGGSVIDTAKGVKLILAHGVDDILVLSGNEILDCGEKVPFIVVPTTCGTGSECTTVAVIKHHETHVKLEFASPALLPDVAVLDPDVIATLPPKLVATTSLDALTHSIEAYCSIQKNVVSDSFAAAAISLINDNLLLCLNSPGKQDFKLNLLNASTLSGLAFSNSMVGIVHAIGHSLGSFKVPHGNAMAILLANCLNFNLEHNQENFSKLLLIFKGPEFFLNTEENLRALKFVEEIKVFVENVARLGNFSLKLKDYGITKNNFEEIANHALNDGAAIFNAKMFNKKDIIEILNHCY